MITESVQCPKHGWRPAVPAIDPDSRAAGFTVCRTCWYREFIAACLRFGRGSRRA